ncbi:sensor histidine kinase [Rubellimicrobium roseum]|nr:histidine kinase dimerization/phosphoacceptor domain -containing protein [Rubellimicrobium roseum]
MGQAARPGRLGSLLLDRFGGWATARRSVAFRWGLATVAFGLATATRFILDPHLPQGFPFLTFFPAITLTAFLAGTVPGVVVMILSGAVAWYWFIPPVGSFQLGSGATLAMGLYVFVTGTEIGLIWLMRRAVERAAEAEAAARAMAQSRSLMFAELQHRVSNNLAVVGSLLALQRRGVADPAAQRALDEAVARLDVVARLSRLLHDPEAQQIDFGAFLRAMVPDAVAAAGAGDRVAVRVVAEPVVVPADRAVPLGLVATELLANALEHGVQTGARGTIHVALEQRGGVARLTVRDDGPGLPEGFDVAGARSLGLSIARQFAQQIGGVLSMSSEGGTLSCLEMPLGERA